MTDRFAALLEELGKVFDISLVPDKLGACSINIPPLTVQFELDATAENFFLFSKIIEIPPGKFRENVLQEALKANGGKDPRPAILGYIAASNHLAMHQIYPLKILTGDNLSGILGAFLEMGENWFAALESGHTSPSPLKQ